MIDLTDRIVLVTGAGGSIGADVVVHDAHVDARLEALAGELWHYAASKVGVVAMTKTIARQYGRQGVTAFAVAPGFVDTPLNRPFVEKYGTEAAAADTGLGEVAQPEDVANVIVFLASGLARHAAGATIDVNGASYVR